MNRSAPAPATRKEPNAIVLRVLAAMSSGERVRIRLDDATQHTGQITRRTNTGLVLDTAAEIPLADVRVIAAAPPPAPKPHRRDRRLAQCAHTLGYRGHCLTKSRRYSTTFKELRQARADHARPAGRPRQRLATRARPDQPRRAHHSLRARRRRAHHNRRRVPRRPSRRESPRKPKTDNSRAKRSMTTTTEEERTNAKHRRI
jgi:hypothetical protein